MQNYDVSKKVEYDTDDEYRSCLLSVFKLTEFGGELTDRIDCLGKEVKDESLLQRAAELGVGFEKDLAFFMLFSYDEFKKTHEILVSSVQAVAEESRG
jgi:hypothetical protein